jgi:hypothetical protein
MKVAVKWAFFPLGVSRGWSRRSLRMGSRAIAAAEAQAEVGGVVGDPLVPDATLFRVINRHGPIRSLQVDTE